MKPTEADPIALFIERCTVPRPCGSVSARDLYAAYVAWAGQGIVVVPMVTFGRMLHERGFESRRSNERQWVGIKLIENALKANDLSFADLARASLARSTRWHKNGIADWSVTDWATAMAGEAGEVCNAVKKLRRLQDEIASLSEAGRELPTIEDAMLKIGKEIADTIIYLDLLAQRCGLNTAQLVTDKFNEVSERYGFPERLG